MGELAAPMETPIPVYYSPTSADRTVPMPMVTAVDIASATPMSEEQMAEFCPAGTPPGFVPMLVGAGSVPVAEPGGIGATAEGAETKKKKKKSSSKEVKVSKKKKSKGCC